MRYEVKVRNSRKPEELKVLKPGARNLDISNEMFFWSEEFATSHTIALLTITEVTPDGSCWCKCEMVDGEISLKPKQIPEMIWNWKSDSVEAAINMGTIYALTRAGILFSVERIKEVETKNSTNKESDNDRFKTDV